MCGKSWNGPSECRSARYAVWVTSSRQDRTNENSIRQDTPLVIRHAASVAGPVPFHLGRAGVANLRKRRAVRKDGGVPGGRGGGDLSNGRARGPGNLSGKAAILLWPRAFPHRP